MRAKKSLGQNWLINPAIHEIIVSALDLKPGEKILEIGPGTGLLTEQLVATGAELLAVEKDSALASKLKTHYQSHNNVKIVEGDILKFDPARYGLGAGQPGVTTFDGGSATELKQSKVVTPGQFKVVGNIPYYLSSHLIRILLEEWPAPTLIVLLLQKEVAERITAQPGELSLLGLAAQYYSQVELLAPVKRADFDPIPAVDSALVRLTPNQKRPDKIFNQKLFRIARAAFGQKRKQLISSLSTNLNLERGQLTQLLTQCQISPQVRPETLAVSAWERLASALSLAE